MGFDIPSVLEKYEKELAKLSGGLKLEVDKHNYAQDIGGGGYVTFKVMPLYNVDNPLAPDDMLVRFYTALSDFVGDPHFLVGDAKFELTVNQKAIGPLGMRAEVRVPMTYSDFGDQVS